MSSPPFRLARLVVDPAATAREGSYGSVAPQFCPEDSFGPRAARRTRLAELHQHVHCSVIGTCLSAHELRRLIPRHADLVRERASDLEIHQAAVRLAIEGGDAS